MQCLRLQDLFCAVIQLETTCFLLKKAKSFGTRVWQKLAAQCSGIYFVQSTAFGVHSFWIFMRNNSLVNYMVWACFPLLDYYQMYNYSWRRIWDCFALCLFRKEYKNLFQAVRFLWTYISKFCSGDCCLYLSPQQCTACRAVAFPISSPFMQAPNSAVTDLHYMTTL